MRRDDDRDQVFEVDRWTRYQWERFRAGDQRAEGVIAQGVAKQPSFGRFAREVFGRLFGDELEEVKQPRPEDRWAITAHEELSGLPEFDRLRRQCRADRLLAGTAALAFVNTVNARLPAPENVIEDPEPLREQVRGLLEFAKRVTGKEQEEIEAMAASVRERGRTAVASATTYAEALDASQVRSALRGATEDARAAADALEGRLGAFCGWGTTGPAGETVSVEVKAELAQVIGGSAKLQQLAREAGRMRRIASAKQRTKSAYARDEVVDIGLGDDLGRLLPSELVRLVDPVLSLEMGRRLLERAALQYELGGKEAQGRGPIVVCVDESSSMEGSKEIWSKALALALLQVATLQRRMCRVIAFSAGVARVSDWHPGKVDPRELLRSMEPFAGGGTSFEPVLTTAREAIEKDAALKRADVILITDGQADIGDEFKDSWSQARRRHEFTCYAVHVDAPGGVTPRVLAELADVTIGLADIAHDSAVTDVLLGI